MWMGTWINFAWSASPGSSSITHIFFIIHTQSTVTLMQEHFRGWAVVLPSALSMLLVSCIRQLKAEFRLTFPLHSLKSRLSLILDNMQYHLLISHSHSQKLCYLWSSSSNTATCLKSSSWEPWHYCCLKVLEGLPGVEVHRTWKSRQLFQSLGGLFGWRGQPRVAVVLLFRFQHQACSSGRWTPFSFSRSQSPYSFIKW